MSTIKIFLHLFSRWTHYTEEQRHVVCLLLNLDKDADFNEVLSKIASEELEKEVEKESMLLTFLRSFTPSALLSDIESGKAPISSSLTCPPSKGGGGGYNVAGIRIAQEEVKTAKTLLYVSEDVYRYVTRHENDWISSKGVCITFLRKFFDYREHPHAKPKVTFYLPKKCTTQIVCLEDELERPVKWDWDVLREALVELDDQVSKAKLSIENLSGTVTFDTKGILWKRDENATFKQPVVEMFMSKAALLFIYHLENGFWKAQNGVSFYCPGACEFSIEKDRIRFGGRQGDHRFTVPQEEWKKCAWTPEKVREALAELSKAVRASNQAADFTNMDTF